jgi:hypothetical protein
MKHPPETMADVGNKDIIWGPIYGELNIQRGWDF